MSLSEQIAKFDKTKKLKPTKTIETTVFQVFGAEAVVDDGKGDVIEPTSQIRAGEDSKENKQAQALINNPGSNALRVAFFCHDGLGEDPKYSQFLVALK